MRKLTQWTLVLAIVSICAPLYAATATEFYVGLLRRGVSEVEAGRDAQAVTPLRIAAFGLVDSIEHYQTAQAYLVIAFDRMNQPEPAREAAMRIVMAERVERKFATLALPAPIRTAFATSARKLLPAADASTLLTAPATRPQQPPQTSAKPATPPAESTSRQAVESASRQGVESTSRPVVEKPAPAPVTTTTTAPPASSTTTSSSTTRRPEDSSTPPKPTPPAPKPVQPQPVKPTVDTPARLAAGERALVAANLNDARRIYRELLDAGGHDHGTWIRVAEGLYRSRDFSGALTAFQRVGTLRSGEEAYRYYIAVAYYETGQYDRAKRELAAALPFIEITPDVQRYRAKIEGAR